MTMTDVHWRPEEGGQQQTTVDQRPIDIGAEEEDEEAGGGIYGVYDPLRREEYGIIRPTSYGGAAEREERRKMRRLRRRRATACVVLMLALAIMVGVLFEELNYGVGFMWYMNRYSAVVQRPVTVRRGENAPSIAIVIILKDSTHDDQYALASSTVHCYAALHGYRLRVVNAAANGTNWAATCPQPDFMFHRHCVFRHLLDGMEEEWVLFLDADIGVVNPDHLIEEVLPSNRTTHIVFYDRIMNHEVMAGSYLVRNNEFSRRFLKYWSDYFFNLPSSFHGTDNGALHNVLLEFALPDLREGRVKCEEMWRQSKDFPSLDDYVVCTRGLMAGRWMEGIEIRNKTHPQRWSRDGWLTNSAWSRRDFMLHGWQKKRLNVLGFARWHSPLANPLSAWVAPDGAVDDEQLAARCAEQGASAGAAWAHKDSFLVTEEEVKNRLEKEIEKQEKSFAEKVAQMTL